MSASQNQVTHISSFEQHAPKRRKNKMDKENYIHIDAWMRDELNLTGNELMIFAIIFGLSQYEGNYMYGGQECMAHWCGISRQSVNKIINKLVHDYKYVEAIEVSKQGSRTTYKYRGKKLAEIVNTGCIKKKKDWSESIEKRKKTLEKNKFTSKESLHVKNDVTSKESLHVASKESLHVASKESLHKNNKDLYKEKYIKKQVKVESKNKFNNYTQNEYDYDELEKLFNC